MAGDEALLHRVELAAGSRPSTVRTSWPSAMAASTVQDFTGTPSSHTTQAPQLEVSQPQWRAGQLQVVAQEVDEQQPRLDVAGVLASR